MKKIDLVIIGGGSAGMAAAIEAYKEGIKDILILEKETHLGGVLNQCIHNGFGITEFKEELTGPEYMQRFIDQIDELKIPYICNAQVIDLTKEKVVTYSRNNEIVTLEAKAIIMATGCYERSAGAIMLPGDRCAGIITAGTAQNLLNIHGYMVGKRVVILGSGDIGLIMARRLTLEGAKVICVSELMPYSNGLNRNIQQCLRDFDIPLYLSRSVSKVIGKDRLEKVILSKVDENNNFIPGTEMEIECDTLVLSVGLIPYVQLLNYIDCPMSSTKGPIVSSNLESQIDGIFACGNCLHVHDVVDFVTSEARIAGHGAANYIKGIKYEHDFVQILPKNGISYVVPQIISKNEKEDVIFKFRVKKPVKNQKVVVKSKDSIIAKIVKPILIPSEIVMIKINHDQLTNLDSDLELYLEDM